MTKVNVIEGKKQTCKFKISLPEKLFLKNKERKIFSEKQRLGYFVPNRASVREMLDNAF